ncbi:DMT family transporter [Rugamonas sp. CCM 8940]|uniref:DMT family transporter n=1 Tax=Rugamonas sp. CCM 8940 TaxID=2765359 RepID=UPI0018F789D7|nr:DMT family transporter [Rugamonas sp. CCM 8940]MBJ7311275.1 EamA family transporter [Rugamonas sp. CCM 8940]
MKTKTPHQSTLLGHLQVVLAMCIVGSSVVAGKFISMEMPVFLASFVRFFLAAVVLIPLNYCMTGRLVRPVRSDMVLLTLQAFFGVFLFSVCMFLGLKQTSALKAGVIMGMLPAVTAVVAVLVLKERLSPRYLVGIALSVAGAVVLELRGASGAAVLGDSIYGILLILGAVVCEALFSVIGKMAGLTIPPVTMTTWMAIIGVILFLPYSIVEALAFDFAAVSPRVWLLLLYYALVVTVLGFMLFYVGLAKISTVAAGVHMAWVPLSAMLIAVLFFGEPFGLAELTSALSVVAAVLVVSAGGKEAAPRPASEVLQQ